MTRWLAALLVLLAPPAAAQSYDEVNATLVDTVVVPAYDRYADAIARVPPTIESLCASSRRSEPGRGAAGVARGDARLAACPADRLRPRGGPRAGAADRVLAGQARHRRPAVLAGDGRARRLAARSRSAVRKIGRTDRSHDPRAAAVRRCHAGSRKPRLRMRLRARDRAPPGGARRLAGRRLDRTGRLSRRGDRCRHRQRRVLQRLRSGGAALPQPGRQPRCR